LLLELPPPNSEPKKPMSQLLAVSRTMRNGDLPCDVASRQIGTSGTAAEHSAILLLPLPDGLSIFPAVLAASSAASPL
jgi:hypothetical protein